MGQKGSTRSYSSYISSNRSKPYYNGSPWRCQGVGPPSSRGFETPSESSDEAGKPASHAAALDDGPEILSSLATQKTATSFSINRYFVVIFLSLPPALEVTTKML